MKEEYKDKTKEQLINELVGLRQRIAELEASENEHKRAEEELRESKEILSNILSASPIGIGVVADRKLSWTNESMLKLFGVENKEDYIGESAEMLYASEEEYERVGRIIYKNLKHKIVQVDAKLKRKDGSVFDGHITMSFLDPSNPMKGAVATISDISWRKRADEERERLLKELEAKNTELERFTYTVSHDLRAPLITIQGFAEMLRKDLEQNEMEKVESDLKFIENGTAKMEHLLKDTLQLSRIGRVANPPEDVPFGEIVQEALEQTTGQIKSSGVEISVVEDFPTVHVNRMRIVEVLVNLITNSINYMGEQVRPKIDIGYRTDDGGTVFFVRDNGIGIDKSQHEKVFEVFYQVDSSSKGTGAGLAIVKRIIEVHGGRIWIESEKGKGCIVCFMLPVM